MTSGLKTTNEYAQELYGIYDDIPKAVLAAIAVSFASCGGSDMEGVKHRIADEWCILHQNGVVPQAPAKSAKLAMGGSDAE